MADGVHFRRISSFKQSADMLAHTQQLGVALACDDRILPAPESPLAQEYRLGDFVVGNRFAQAPKRRATATLLWTPAPWELRLDAHHESNRYDDARNSRLLDDSFSFDLSLTRNLSDDARLRLSVNNLTDAEIQTGLSSVSSGAIISTGAPRNFLLKLEWGF